MAERLQGFSFRESAYQRPTQDWVCGRLAEGCPCQIGPDGKGNCRADYECRPRRDGHRFVCTRSAFAGGPCETGPRPNGICCREIPKCQPVRSWRSRRGATAKWVAAVTVALVMITVAGLGRAWFLSPGNLTTKHAELGQCATCHSAYDQGPSAWLHAAFAESAPVSDSKACLACHNLGEDSFRPHSLAEAEIAKLSENAAPATGSGRSVDLQLATLVFSPPQENDEVLTCATCHREHQGMKWDLTAQSNERCMACHTAQFNSFADGHPSFGDFPYSRRTRIKFDHTSHIGKHFAEADAREVAPKECKACHEPDANGNLMVVRDFETVCAACHGGQVAGDGRAGSKGLAVLSVPGFDVESLREREVPIGGWPEDSEAAVTPFMDFLLSGDGDYVSARAALADVDLLDLTEADDDQIAAVAKLAWSVKGLLFDLRTRGIDALRERLDDAFGRSLSTGEINALAALLPADTIELAQRSWYPDLLREVALFRDGSSVPMPSEAGDEEPVAEPEEEDAAENEEGDDIGDDDIGDDDIGDDEIGDDEDDIADADDDEFGDDDDIGDEDDEDIDTDEDGDEGSDADDVEMAGVEDRMAAGGWYRDDFVLRYRPVGHADAFMKNWLDITGAATGNQAATAIFGELSADKGVGLCIKCHSVDSNGKPEVDGAMSVNWRGRLPVPNHRGFTKYSHTAHFSLMDEKGCRNCHVRDPEADVSAAYADADPHKSVSNFVPIDKNFCAQCHVPTAAGDSCLTCHNYHIGDLPPAVISTDSMAAAPTAERHAKKQ